MEVQVSVVKRTEKPDIDFKVSFFLAKS